MKYIKYRKSISVSKMILRRNNRETDNQIHKKKQPNSKWSWAAEVLAHLIRSVDTFF